MEMKNKNYIKMELHSFPKGNQICKREEHRNRDWIMNYSSHYLHPISLRHPCPPPNWSQNFHPQKSVSYLVKKPPLGFGSETKTPFLWWGFLSSRHLLIVKQKKRLIKILITLSISPVFSHSSPTASANKRNDTWGADSVFVFPIGMVVVMV